MSHKAVNYDYVFYTDSDGNKGVANRGDEMENLGDAEVKRLKGLDPPAIGDEVDRSLPAVYAPTSPESRIPEMRDPNWEQAHPGQDPTAGAGTSDKSPSEMKVDELKAEADALGIQAETDWKKDDYVKAVEQARSDAAADAALVESAAAQSEANERAAAASGTSDKS
jgi:hypothetical protein